MKGNIKKVKTQRRFSEDFKRHLVDEYERGKFTVLELSKLYKIDLSTIYDWIYKYSYYNKQSIKVVEMSESSEQKVGQLEGRIKELERIVGQKQLQIDYLEKMIELAGDELGIDIKKNSGTPQSTGLEKTKKD